MFLANWALQTLPDLWSHLWSANSHALRLWLWGIASTSQLVFYLCGWHDMKTDHGHSSVPWKVFQTKLPLTSHKERTYFGRQSSSTSRSVSSSSRPRSREDWVDEAPVPRSRKPRADGSPEWELPWALRRSRPVARICRGGVPPSRHQCLLPAVGTLGTPDKSVATTDPAFAEGYMAPKKRGYSYSCCSQKFHQLREIYLFSGGFKQYGM